MSDMIRLVRVVGILAANPDLRFRRADLATALTTPRVVITLRSLTRLWPQIEARLAERDLFAVRPIGHLSYGVMATRNPLLAFLSLHDREKNIVTRLDNDRAGLVLQAMAAGGGEMGMLAQGRLNRIQTYLDAYHGSEMSTWRINMEALAAYRLIPWGTFPANRSYASDWEMLVSDA